jgi:translation initiation factor 2 gamma subunit (eIF-2gamma)
MGQTCKMGKKIRKFENCKKPIKTLDCYHPGQAVLLMGIFISFLSVLDGVILLFRANTKCCYT